MDNIFLFLAVYWVLLGIMTAIITAVDKSRAKNNGWRTPEKTLIILALLGAALPEYITMKKIRHKTQHKKFMIGLPLIMVLHIVIVSAVLYFIYLK